MASNLRVAIYSRVSTLHDQNPEVQSSELRDFCKARGWLIVEEFVDHGYSGGTDKRPGLTALLKITRSRRVDIVCVVKLDRLGRSLRHLIDLLEEFNTIGVQFVSIRDQIDLTTASGRLMAHLLAAFGEFERGLVRERTLAGLAFARSRGKTLGRPKKRNDEAILKLRNEGLSYSQIQKRLGVSRPSIHRTLLAAGGTKSSSVLPKKTQTNQGPKND